MQTLKHVVYGLVCPNDNIIRYVGKTRDLEIRVGQHLYKKEGSKEKYSWITQLRANKQRFIVVVLFQTDNAFDAKIAEWEHINKNKDTVFNVTFKNQLYQSLMNTNARRRKKATKIKTT